jgi:D-alanyl-D-alanine carboxypeptidase
VPSHRADTPAPLRRPRDNRSGRKRRPARRSTSLSAPQVGIAGALGIATIAAPMSGMMGGAIPKAQVNQISAVSSVSAAAMPAMPAFPTLPKAAGKGVEALSVVPTVNLEASAPAMLAAPQTVIVSRASRSGERSVLPGCDGVIAPTAAANGELPDSSLCTLWDPKHRLRSDAAVALAKLNVAYKQHFGNNICLTDSYRTIAEQRRLRAIKPALAAVPGTSQHGWGLAVDLCDGIETGSGARYQWMRANAPAYGWENPAWALPGGGGPHEPWHWEYVIGESASDSGE